ncbi:MAG: class I SAM-dependent methyltransferase [Ruminococcaceae bacterium]|nr:class I SAM-dependent methyltransferase [Oscillospiraceae bacterium]
MSNYDVFASVYDRLTLNVNYSERAEYIMNILNKFGHEAGITLDLACGTGNMTLELYKRGVDVYGVDASPSMLMEAKDKAYDMEADILFLCQKMQEIDLYGTVNTVVSTLDSINHLPTLNDIKKTFERVSLFMEEEGLFIFDFNTVYKHKNVLGNNTFIYDLEDVFCAWQNRYKSLNNRVTIELDFFLKKNGLYERQSERFSEITFENEVVSDLLKECGFKEVYIYDDMSFYPPKKDSQRVVFVAKK